MQATIPLARERDLISTALLTTGLVLATVTMTFGVMIAVFIYRSEGKIWWGRLAVPSVLWVTTAILLTSSYALEHARRLLLRNEQDAAFHWFSYTAGLGLAFLIGQIAAWFQVIHSGISLAGNAHSWFVFLFTALHGMHIVVGLAGLLWVVVRTRARASGPRYQAKTKAVALGVSVFWHYLDVLWIVLFTLLLTWHR
ncbi:MAG: cytochrome c oxidase subunit 3 [Acidobacteriaceae bacterium]|nr:cytochrome c oxidase subunit 3 [Acidobacteriaceae bacterium]